jgi:hypothetical protein
MRARFLALAAVALLVVATVAVFSPGVADDATEERLGDLETRVAALETQVAGASETGNADQDGEDGQPGRDGQDGEDGQAGTSSSSSSSTQQSPGSFSGVYSGTGERVIEIELNNSGNYQLTLNASGVASVVLTSETGAAGTVTRTGTLDAGTYGIEVRSDDSWSITLLLLN